MYFDFYYSIDYDFRLGDGDISTAAITLARVADETTSGNRSKWGLFIYGSEVGVGFDCAGCRDRFIENYERFAGQDDDAPPASMKRVRGRSRPTCSDPIATDDPCAQA